LNSPPNFPKVRRLKNKLIPVLFAALSGMLSALAFPKFGLLFLAWISLLPLLFGLIRTAPRQSFWLGLLGGIVFYAILVYWIPAVPAHYGNLSLPVSFLIYLILIILLALSWAFFAWIFAKIGRPYPRLAFLLAPFIWVSAEYILTHILTGFPWGLLGLSQYRNILLIQIASLTGVYGISFVLVLFQSLFVYSVNFRKRNPFLIGVAIVLILHAAGLLSLKKVHPAEDSFPAAVIQGNVSSDIYWDQVSDSEIMALFRHHIELSQKALAQGAKFIVWPEFSVPLCFSCTDSLYQNLKEELMAFVRENQCTLLLGTNEVTGPPENQLYHNTALCLKPDLTYTTYYKMHLVPFGEYTPYKKIFSFIQRMTHAIGEVTAGTEHKLHSFNGLRFGSPICYEIIFPDLVRKFAKKGSHFLVTITNDGWYGKTSAPHQHFANAVLRAVENRRYVLRAATTGISGIIDPYGRILAKSSLLTRTYLTGEVTPATRRTVYSMFGDIFSWISLTISGVFLILALFKRKNGQKRNRSQR
jgi:apolipoprotein N-acyltransferase